MLGLMVLTGISFLISRFPMGGMMWGRKRVVAPPVVWIVQTDGAIGTDGSGMGVVVRDATGHWVTWLARRDRPMTNNEAEYGALCYALDAAVAARVQTVHVYSDSDVMVNQMRGHYRVHSAGLRTWHERACALARRIPTVTYTYIPRERNQLADALAAEALCAPLPAPNAF